MSVDNFKMDVEVGTVGRRLPVYLLIDCSGSMSGTPIAAVQNGVEQFAREVASDTFASQMVHVAVITFDTTAHVLTKSADTNGALVPIEKFQPPKLSAEGTTSLGQALTELNKSLNNDVKAGVKGGEKGDYKPLVFILTDGVPTDDWKAPRQEIESRQERKVVNVITVGCGNAINEQNLKAIAIGPTFKIDDTSESFMKFFQYVSQSVQFVSKQMSQPGAGNQPLPMQAPDPNIFQYIP